MQSDALGIEAYLHLNSLRQLVLVSCLSVVTNQITKINGFFRGWRKGVRQAQGRPVRRMKRASLMADPGWTSHTKPRGADKYLQA
jgi:hypothetical protein